MKRLALIGYGRIAPRHLEVFRALECEIVASCNRSEQGRQKATSEGGIPRTYSDVAAMLEKERPDGVICCASADQMAVAAGKILPFGIPTLLEKPPGISLAELAVLKASAAQHKTPVMVGLNRRYYSVLTSAIEDAGGLEAITAVFVDWSEEPEYLLRDRGFSPLQVAQRVYGNSLHGLDLLAFLSGEISAPSVIGRCYGEPFRWMMSLQGVSQRGVLATFQSTWDSPSRWRLVFCSRKRRYQFAPLESCVVSELEKKETRTIEPDELDKKFKPGFYRQAQTFLEMIDTRQVSRLHGLESAEMSMTLAERLTDACLAQRDASDGMARSLKPHVNGRESCQKAVSPSGRQHSQLRVVAMADSMAMVRSEPLVIRWEDTWPAQLANELRAAGIDAEVINCGARGRTADQLLEAEFEEHVVMKRPDVVVMQVGITDCVPRIISRSEHTFLNRRFVPAGLRDWIVRRRSARRAEILRNSDPLRKVYTRPDQFGAYLASFARRLEQLDAPPRLIVLPIVCNAEVMDRKSPGHRGNVARYNALLRTFALAAGADWLEPNAVISDEDVAESFADDGYHFSPFGCGRCAQALAALIAGAESSRPENSEVAPEHAS